MTPDRTSIWVAQVELAGALVPVGVSRPRRPEDDTARILVRLHRQVLGFVSISLAPEEIDGGVLMAAVEAQLGPSLAAHRDRAHQSTSPSKKLISVVVCTRDRPEILRTCLGRLQQLRYPNFEVVVVDNAPTSTRTRDCFTDAVGDDGRFRYVIEPVAGLSRARNRGLHEAAGTHVAFTDDDVQVDPWWLDAISAGFARDAGAGCVTGLVPPAELEHPSQHYFDRRYSWASVMEPCVHDLTNGRLHSPLYPYSAGVFGTGANFAVDRALVIGLGGFDEALGAGSLARGGEDLDVFVRVLRAGRTLVYEPSAIVWHVHRAGSKALRQQLYAYGVGLTAFLSKYAADPQTRRDILLRLPQGARRIPHMWSPSEISGQAPRSFVAAEVLGMLAGPPAYLRGRLPLRRTATAA